MPRYTKAEFAQKENITVAVLNSWIYKHGLPVIQIGKRTYITEEDFNEWFLKHKKVISERPVEHEPVAMPRQCQKVQKGIFSKLRLAR